MARLPMTADEFFAIFRAYNEAFWPAPLVLTALALVAAFLTLRPDGGRGRFVLVILALLWAWSGIAYHVLHHAPYNPVAYVFGALFVIQAFVFLRHIGGNRRIVFGPRLDAFGIVGGVLVVYALVIYPLIGHLLGHRYPGAPTFGAPCPVTIFTFGMLLWTAGRVPGRVLVIPALWAFVAVGAALSWGVLEDIAMPVAALVACAMLLGRNRRIGQRPASGRLDLLARAGNEASVGR